ncbi:MAG: cobalt-precorrin-5B (C(1))-methyltransferase [Myxococcota bacterium]
MPRSSPETPLRTGFTTGANACAAAVAAARALAGLPLQAWEGPLPALTADRYDVLAGAVTVAIPNGEHVRFPVRTLTVAPGRARASVVKDGGDDPDCTHRAEIWAEVEPADDGVVRFVRGEGVGVVTRPGLGIPVGAPSITAPPRENIAAEILGVLPGGARVTLGIVDGEALARRTLNARLGVEGGLSILGTTGIVHPYSTAAFRASVTQAIDVAVANGLDEVVLTTGGRSERFAQDLLPALPEVAFVQMGDFVGHALAHASALGIRTATLCGMIGKLSKMADGRTMTHAAGSEVDCALLAEIARAVGADDAAAAAITAANTGRHVQEIVQEARLDAFFDALCERAAVMLGAHLAGRPRPADAPPMALRVLLTDFSGPLLGAYPPGVARPGDASPLLPDAAP